MEAALAAAAAWLDAIGLGPWARGSGQVYPIANTLHLLGLVLLVGGIGVVDLRIAGFWRAIPLSPLSRALTSLAVVGLGIMAVSGTILFAADGPALATSATFRTKLVLIAVALGNAIAFRLLWRDRGDPPAAARAMALASVGLWLAIGGFGRWIAYS